MGHHIGARIAINVVLAEKKNYERLNYLNPKEHATPKNIMLLTPTH